MKPQIFLFLILLSFSAKYVKGQNKNIEINYLAPIIKSDHKFYIDNKQVSRYIAIQTLKTDSIAYDTFKTGKLISYIGVGIYVGTVMYVMAETFSSISAISAGGYNQTENKKSSGPAIGLITGVGFIIGGFIYKKSAWRIYNNKFKKDIKLNFSPIINSNKVGINLNF